MLFWQKIEVQPVSFIQTFYLVELWQQELQYNELTAEDTQEHPPPPQHTKHESHS